MQDLRPEWSALCDLDDVHRKQAHLAAMDTLADAQTVLVFPNVSGGFGVHGDMRSNNIMAAVIDGVLKICFVDFEWAGEEGGAR